MLAQSAGRGAAGWNLLGQAYRPGFAFPSGDPTHPIVSVHRRGVPFARGSRQSTGGR